MIRLLHGDCLALLPTLPAESVQCVVTSPPYFGLRDYQTGTWDGGNSACSHAPRAHRVEDKETGTGRLRDKPSQTCKCGAVRIDQQIGLEQSPQEYVDRLVAVFREVRRVLRKDGVVFLNLGDSYYRTPTTNVPQTLLKPKDLMMIPARVALALQQDGWWIRSKIIWAKPNPMPESCQDRPTSSYEEVFLLTRSERYFYDAQAIAEPFADERMGCDGGRQASQRNRGGFAKPNGIDPSTNGARNARNVWTIATTPYPGAHFATMPPALAERCIKAGSRVDDTVLDPFAGAATTLMVADRLQRHGIGIELNAEYHDLARARIEGDCPLFAEVA